MATEFRLLGNIEAHLDGNPINIGYNQLRAVLAVLLVEVNHIVSVDQLVERVWGGRRLPRRPRNGVQHCVTLLRGALAAVPEVTIAWRATGYQLTADPDTVDLHRYRTLVTRARAAGNEANAVALFEQALSLWHGEPVAGLDTPWFNALRDTVTQEHHAAELDRTDLLLEHGNHTSLLPALTDRARRHPLDERVAGQVMLAYYRNGRAAHALEHYRQLRQRLADELGTDPGPALQQLFQQVLAGDPVLTAPAGPAGTPTPVPRQLPAAPRMFTGRTRELATLTGTLDDRADAAATVVISALSGAGGIGKTWLALHWAHQHLDRFPDGQLFVDLRGFSPDGQPMPAETAVRGFLDALGVNPAQLPADPHVQAARYRSLVADKRMLIVLDNAADTEQVVPLLPGSPTATVIVTSRRHLTGLITRYGTHHLPLDILSDTESRALLEARVTADRFTAEPDAVAELLAFCEGFPLALSIVASRAVTRPHVSLAALAAELGDARLGTLEDGEPAAGLSTALSWSYHALTAGQARVFGLLGIAPGPDISLSAAASLAELSTDDTKAVLRELERASLIAQDARGRYAMHDLIRAYAAGEAHRRLPPAERTAALLRVVDFYIHTAHAADRLLDPYRALIPPDPSAPGTRPLRLHDRVAALSWLDTELPNLLAAQQTAAGRGWHYAVWQLAWQLGNFHDMRGHIHGALTVCQAAVEAAACLTDVTLSTRALRRLGHANAALGRGEDAIRHLHVALDLAERHHLRAEQAGTHRDLAWAWGEVGEDRRALDHAGQALRLFRLVAPAWEAHMLNMVGWFTARVGRYADAREHCQAALTLHRGRRNTDGEATTLDSLGYIDHHTGNHHDAVEHYRHALVLFGGLGNSYESADTLVRLGDTHTALGQPDHARTAWREALDLYRQQGRDEAAQAVLRRLDELG